LPSTNTSSINDGLSITVADSEPNGAETTPSIEPNKDGEDINTVLPIAIGAAVGGLVLLIALVAVVIWLTRSTKKAAPSDGTPLASIAPSGVYASASVSLNSKALPTAGVYAAPTSASEYGPAPPMSQSDGYERIDPSQLKFETIVYDEAFPNQAQP
jgi:hypothetical protein